MSQLLAYNKNRLPDYLQMYYKKGIFPFKPYTSWLTYSKKPSEYFSLREFSIAGKKDGEEIHLRFQKFGDPVEFEKELCRVSPHLLAIGPVRIAEPDYEILERELFFDIDLNDYDGYRKCCEGATVCGKCWKFIVMAVKILDARLRKREEFGFTALLYVFSGRRGVHCWVGDEKARSIEDRSSYQDFLSSIFKLPIEKEDFDNLALQSCYNVIMNAENGELVKEMVVEQKWLMNEKVALKGCNSQLKEELQRIFTFPTPENRWEVLRMKCDEKTWRAEREKLGEKNVPTCPSEDLRFFLFQWVLCRCYSNIRVISKSDIHKTSTSPFSIHQKTGNIAVPIDADSVHLFDVTKCPRVDQLLEELDNLNNGDDKESKENRKVLAYKHTSLAPYVETFEKFVEKTKMNRSKNTQISEYKRMMEE